MSNSYDEIKNLLKSSRKLLSKDFTINEVSEIKKKHGLILEQTIMTSPIDKINVGQTIEKEIEKDEYETAETEKETPKREKKKSFRIAGGVLNLYGKDENDIILTTAEKDAFLETMNEFVDEVSDAVDYEPLNLYPKNVIWSGILNKFNVKFIYNLMDGVYLTTDLNEDETEESDSSQQTFEMNLQNPIIKLDEEFTEVTEKLMGYFKKFENKWNMVISNRKQTPSK